MPVPSNTNGTTTDTATSAKGEEVDPIAEAVAKATQGRAEFDSAAEAATDDTEEPEDETAGKKKPGETTEDTDTESEEEDDDEPAEGADKEELLTLDDVDDMKPGEVVNLSLKRVRPEDRDTVRRMKAQLSKAFQAAAAAQTAKRNGEDPPEKKPTKKQAEEKTYSDEELYEMAMEGPEGFKKATQIAMAKNLDDLLEARGIAPKSEQERTAELVEDAIDLSARSKEYADLKDDRFRQEVGTILASDDDLNQKFARAIARAIEFGDTEGIQMVVEKAADRAKTARYKRTEAARARQRTDKETLNAKETGSLAAKSTTKSAPPAPKKGAVPVEDSVGDAIKRAGGSAFR